MKALIELGIMLRCTAAFYTFIIAVAFLRLACAILPADHPGRIYVSGRGTEGAKRMREALSERAAIRYIASRRPRY